MTVLGIPEAQVIVPEVQEPAGCWALWGNEAVPVSTSLFALRGTCPAKPPAQWICLRWLGVWLGCG